MPTLKQQDLLGNTQVPLSFFCGCDGIGIHMSLKMTVLRVRVPPSVPIGVKNENCTD